MNGDEDAIARARELEANLIQQRLSNDALRTQLRYRAVEPVRSGAREGQELLSSKPVHPADKAVMRRAGRLSGQLLNEGNIVDDADASSVRLPTSSTNLCLLGTSVTSTASASSRSLLTLSNHQTARNATFPFLEGHLSHSNPGKTAETTVPPR